MALTMAEKREALMLAERMEWKERRHKARTDLYFLLTDVLGRRDMERVWIQERCDEVQNDPDGYLDLWAREHYKSTIITFGKTIQDILASHGDDPLPEWEGREVTVGIFSHTRPNAKGFLRQIKNEFERNESLRELFPDIFWNDSREAPKWSEDDGIIVRRKGNPKEATVEAWGVVDGQPTGKHFLITVYDDIVTKESVTSPEMIKKTTESLELSYNLGSDGGARRFIGTRYHFNDTYAEVMKRKTAIPRLHPATHDGTVDGEPVLLSQQALREKYRDQGPYTFSCQMLQNPKGDETQGFREDWLRQYDGDQFGKGNRYIMVDPASGKRVTNDYTSMWVIELGIDRNYYVLDIVRDRLNLTQRARRLMELHRKYKPIQVRYEKYGLQADVEHIKTVQQSEQYRFDIVEVGGGVGKNDRIKRLMPLFEEGRVYLPRTCYRTNYQSVTEDLVQTFINEEYKAFPVPVHDDMLDSLARIAEPDTDDAGKPEWARMALKWPIEDDKPIRLNFSSEFA
jgi:predicted phage terminase large subunit-like protein